MLQELLAHPDQRRGAARRQVQAADQLLPPRLRRGVQRLDRLDAGVLRDGLDRGLDGGPIRAEPVGQRPEEGQPLLGPGRVEGGEQRPGEGDARGFAAPRQEQVAEGREIRRRDRPGPFPAAEQRAAAVGQRVEQVPEEGGSALARCLGDFLTAISLGSDRAAMACRELIPAARRRAARRPPGRAR